MENKIDFSNKYISAFRSDGTKGKQYKITDCFNKDYLESVFGQELAMFCEDKREEDEW